MRSVFYCCLLLAIVSVSAIAHPVSPPPSAASLLLLHPGPWRMPVAPPAGVRFDPETGEKPVLDAAARGTYERAATDARARAEARIRILPDGSRHSVVGAAFRFWTVATLDEQGRLTEDCVPSLAQARGRVDAAARKQVRK